MSNVKVVSPQYGQMHEATTDSVGTYRIEGLQPGTYSVTFTAPGLAALRVGSVMISGSVTTTVNGQLQLGAVQTTVTVEAGAAQVIDTQSGQLGASLSTREIESLPYGSFNAAELALTLPGVQDVQGGAVVRTTSRRAVTLFGQRHATASKKFLDRRSGRQRLGHHRTGLSADESRLDSGSSRF